MSGFISTEIATGKGRVTIIEDRLRIEGEDASVATFAVVDMIALMVALMDIDARRRKRESYAVDQAQAE
jgi:hypothetical protein